MKVIVSESKLGDEYTWDVISTCDQNGLKAIADSYSGKILIYDPKKNVWATNKTFMMADTDIWELVGDQTMYDQTMMPAKGAKFDSFKATWNSFLQRAKGNDKDITASPNCEPFPETTMTLEEFVKNLKSAKPETRIALMVNGKFEEYAVSCTVDKNQKILNVLEHDKYYGKVGEHEWTAKDYLSVIQKSTGGNYDGWTVRECGRTVTSCKMDKDNELCLDHVYEQMDESAPKVVGRTRKPRKEFMDKVEKFRGKWKSLDDKGDYVDDFGDRVNGVEAEVSENFKPIDSAYLDDGEGMDAIRGDDWYGDSDNYDTQERWERRAKRARKMGKRVCWRCGGVFKPDCDEDMCPNCQKIEEQYMSRNNSKRETVSESDDPRDWSASEGEVEIMWDTDEYEDFGIFRGEGSTYLIDYDRVDTHDQLVNELCRLIGKEYPDLDFDPSDFVIVNEDEFWEQRGGNPGKWDDDDLYLENGDGNVVDVTLTFTHGHYGKKLNAGDERTIKVDPSTAPEMYDEDDFMAWIADVASDQVPGGGCFTKYDFEIPDDEAYKIIKAVKGDEGFGPDVDVDFEDFEPEDVPSEISYGDALKFYKKMHDAYDDRKLDYTKYDKIRKRLMNAIVKGLLKEKSLDELADEWFIDYGTMNGWGWKTSFKYNVACALHEIHKKKHPDEHVPDRVDTVRGWHEDNCSCGLRSSCDSSD